VADEGENRRWHEGRLFLPRNFCYFYPMETSETSATISIDDFKKIELKVATITAAEPHPNADRLIVLQVDLGTEQRQICAGIRNHYTPEQLVGRQIVVVANLATAKLRGLESQGMLLAASSGDQVIIMTPDKPALAGSIVK
jgi:methionyl-tRNA synthetase